jgi:A/G-specific adenine glycosylase
MTHDFPSRLIAWQLEHGRHDLPWQSADPYRVWVSEIMLQQTQVATAKSYFLRFMARFPDVPALANASEDDVMAAWSGLGYYRRARMLHAAARRMVERHGGRVPDGFESLLDLPGIGRSTAGAIAALAFGARRAILDGNVKRVFARHAGIDGWPGDAAVERRLWTLAEQRLPDTQIEPYTQGLMDLGATLCTRTHPDCPACPVRGDCVALRDQRTDELPAARPRKPLPVRSVTMLILLDRGRVLIEKRAPVGVWPGLWSLPETTDEEPLAGLAALGVEAGHATTLAPIRHGFTHFRLDIAPLLVQVRCLRPRAESPGREWLDLNDVDGAALPAPVKKLLGGLARATTTSPVRA